KNGLGGRRWCVVGDFNAVCSMEERVGINMEDGRLLSTEVSDFRNFVENLELVDLPLLGRRFTWYQSSGKAMSRIDRILISDDWASRWGNVALWVLPRDVSDHCPLVLKYRNDDWGPKPFRFNNFWLENKKLIEVVESFWESYNVEGWMGFVLKEKLKVLKSILRNWHKEEYGGVEAKIEELVVEIKDLDVRGELVGLSNQEVDCRKQKFASLWKFLKNKEALMFQRSRSKWLKEGDANTKFFHGSVKSRSKRNLISAIRVDEGWLDSPNLIKEAVSIYFTNHVSSSFKARPKLDGVVFPTLAEEANVDLISPFSLEEIEEVVKCSDGNKSPGPDGFNFAFLKKFWGLLKGDIRIMFDQFHGNSCLPSSFLSYFVTLIPKVSSPSSLSEFRPISLLGCLYKIIAKVLAKRLAKVMDFLISSNQSAFIKGRNLVDSALVVNEVVDWAKKSKKECLIFKVDFEKAYDSVDWGFLDYMLHRFGFCDKWIEWMRACTFAGNLSVLVNGSPTGEIGIQRGLKQGDPLAPFLFLLVVEGLSGVVSKAVDLRIFKGLAVGSPPVVISHLQYADDTLCIGEASVENLWAIKAILRGFEMASGLKVNFWKSGLIGVNVPSPFLEMASSFLNCRLGAIPFKYLGLPIGANPKRLATWNPLLEHLKKRPLWKEVLVARYGSLILHDVDWSFLRANPSASIWWKNIVALDNVVPGKNWLVDSMARKLGNGLSTSFWNTKWIGEVPLALAFPRLFSLSNHKDNVVQDFLESEEGIRSWSFSWRRNLFQWEEDRVVVLKELLESATFTLEDDCWTWLPDEEGEFSVKSAYKFLLEELEPNVEVEGGLGIVLDKIWDSPAPSKAIAFSWQLLYDRIPTRSNLEVRGIMLPETPWECMGCIGKVETSTHLFLHCPCVMMVWSEIFKWLGVLVVIPPSIASLFEVLKEAAKNVKIRRGFVMIWHATLWSIWKARNNAIFATGVFNPRMIVEDIKVLSWKWCLARLKVSPCLFYEWSWDPGDCLLR
ncbi:cysteine-rich receptor-like protein kinase, partial [Trifolium pratense]